MKIFKNTLMVFGLCVGAFAHADINMTDKLTVGILANLNADAYRTDDTVSAVPLVLYNGDRFYAEGSQFGVFAYKDQKHWAKFGLSYDGRHFDPDDAKTQDLKGLDERKTSINLNTTYMYISPVGGFEFKSTQDVSNRHGGQTLALAHRSKFDLMQNRLTVYPQFGITWYSTKYNDYYYSVHADEAKRTSLPIYTAKHGFSPFVSVSAKYQISEHIGIFGNQRIEWLSDTQKNSPLTDGSTQSSTNVGLTYTF